MVHTPGITAMQHNAPSRDTLDSILDNLDIWQQMIKHYDA